MDIVHYSSWPVNPFSVFFQFFIGQAAERRSQAFPELAEEDGQEYNESINAGKEDTEHEKTRCAGGDGRCG